MIMRRLLRFASERTRLCFACKMVEMGAEDYLVKGRIDRDSLVRAMRYGIERHRLKRELEHITISAGRHPKVQRACKLR